MDWRLMPSLNSLRAFAAVAETGNFTAAGRQLNVTHAAISQQVRALESHLDCPLVVRDGRGVALTPEGRQLFQGVQSGFERIMEAVEILTGSNAERPLSVSTTPTFAVSWLMPRISDFRNRHPAVELSINPTAEVIPLEPGGIDLSIRYGAGHWSGLDSEMLVPSNYVVVGATCLVGNRPDFKPEDLLQFPWLQELGTNEVALWLKSQGVVPDKKLNISNLPGYMVLDGVRRGHGITAMSRFFLRSEIEAGTLRVLFEDIKAESAGYYIVTRPGIQREPAKAFLSWLRSMREEQAAV